MAQSRCQTCHQRMPACACPPPDPLDTTALVVLEHQARICQRTQGVAAACHLLLACAALPTELPPPLQSAVEGALATIRQLLLPPPPPPKATRGRPPDFDSDDAFRAALDKGLKRFPRRKKLTKEHFASYVLVQTSAGTEEGLSERALTDNLKLFGVDWKAFKGTYKNGKNSGG